MIEAARGGINLALPTLIECDEIPNNRDEIPIPDAALHQPHLKHIAQEIPALDPEAHILLLLGCDILTAHKVRKQTNGPHNTPFGQKLDLGWVLVGDVCLGDTQKPIVSGYQTNILENGRPSLFIDTETDTFTFKVSVDNKPFTCHGVLSVINSLFDPLGFVAPVTIQ